MRRQNKALPLDGLIYAELAQAQISSLAVIPGWPRGPGPESKNICAAAIVRGLAFDLRLGGCIDPRPIGSQLDRFPRAGWRLRMLN
jgi:hypothetical protein